MSELRQADRQGIAFLRFLRLSAHTTASRRGRRTSCLRCGCLRCGSSRHGTGSAYGGHHFRSCNSKHSGNAHGPNNAHGSGSICARAGRTCRIRCACCAAKPADTAVPDRARRPAGTADTAIPNSRTGCSRAPTDGNQSHRRRSDQDGIHRHHGCRSRHRSGRRPGARTARLHRVLLRRRQS